MKEPFHAHPRRPRLPPDHPRPTSLGPASELLGRQRTGPCCPPPSLPSARQVPQGLRGPATGAPGPPASACAMAWSGACLGPCLGRVSWGSSVGWPSFSVWGADTWQRVRPELRLGAIWWGAGGQHGGAQTGATMPVAGQLGDRDTLPSLAGQSSVSPIPAVLSQGSMSGRADVL